MKFMQKNLPSNFPKNEHDPMMGFVVTFYFINLHKIFYK